MKKIIKLLALVGTLMIFSVTAYAECQIKAEWNSKTNLIEIQATGLNKMSTVNIVIADASEAYMNTLESGDAAYIAQNTADMSGTISAEVGLKKASPSGDYVVYIVDKTGEISKSEPFKYYSKTDLDTVLSKINNASAITVYDVLKENSQNLNIDVQELQSISDKQNFGSIFVGLKPSGGYTDASELMAAYGKAVLTAGISGSSNPTVLIEKYSEDLGITLPDFTSYSKEAWEYAGKLLAGGKYTSVSQFFDRYNEAVVAGDISKSKTAGDLQTKILRTYREKLSISTTQYNKLINPTKVFQKLLNNDFTGYTDIVSKFNSAVSTQLSAEEKNQSSNSSGSGGSGMTAFPQQLPNSQIDDIINRPPDDNNKPPENYYTYYDILDVAWAVDDIEYLSAKGVISGDGNGSFRPHATVTRAEFVKILVSAFSITGNGEEMAFEDVKADSWYRQYVSAAYNAGIVQGVSNTWFGAADNITREDLAVMCSRAAEKQNITFNMSSEKTVNDESSIAEYAVDSVKEMCRAGIINGDENGNFNPKSFATRAEAAKIVAGILRTMEADK